MSTTQWVARDVFSAAAVGLVWLLAAVFEPARAQAWVPVDHAELDTIFVEHGAALEAYHSVTLDPLSVWFDESNAEDVELDAHLAQFRAAYMSAFTRRLSARGLEIVSGAAPGVLRLHVEIVDLMVNEYTEAQLAWAERYRFPTAPEHLTLVAELSDASTGEVLLRVADLGLPGDAGAVWNAVQNSFDGWAVALADFLTQGPSLAAR